MLEMEQMGGKIRDTDDEYVGAEGRYDDKLMFSPRMSPNHATEVTVRVWGTTFKPALKKECQRLGVKIYDRVMVTSLLTEKGVQGARVVGATGFNNRTGEFMVFKSKAAVLSTAGSNSLGFLNTELAGYNTFPGSRTKTGDGVAMAWRAGAELTLMEQTTPHGLGTGLKHTWYGGACDASFENIQQVDANGKKLPWPLQGWPDGGAMGPSPENRQKIIQGIQDGTYALPFFGDFPAMSDVERRVTWKLMLGEESTTRNITSSYEKAGFNPAKHLLMNYSLHRRNQSFPLADSRPRRPRRRLGPEIKPRWAVHRRRITCSPQATTATPLRPDGMPAAKPLPMPRESTQAHSPETRSLWKKPASTPRSTATTASIGKNCTPALPALMQLFVQ